MKCENHKYLTAVHREWAMRMRIERHSHQTQLWLKAMPIL